MAAGTMATAAGAAVLLYYLMSRRWAAKTEDEESGDLSKTRSGRRRIIRRPAQAPATWLETITTLSETLRFTYSETLGKWPIADLAFGINYLMRRQGNLHVASVYAGSNCLQLKGQEIIAELQNLLRLLTLCMFFSKKPFPVFLDAAGYSLDDVLLQKPKAGILKPAFTIIHDKNLKHFLLLIRGTHSIKDTLTAATGAVVPFHHSVLHDGGISNLVLGYAHCGMVAAARWIAKLSTPSLLKALAEYPDHKLKHYRGDISELELYFVIVNNEYGEQTEEELLPGGRNIRVTNENVITFIHLVSNHRLNFQIRQQSSHFMRGFQQLIQKDWIDMFNEHELQLLISGSVDSLDIDDLRTHTNYAGGYHSEHYVIEIFWEVLKGFTMENQKKFLKFVTGCSRGPLLGFKYLEPLFCIQRASGSASEEALDRLPTSATCMNLLKLPPYRSKEQLETKLLYAINADAGFDLS